MAGRIVDRNMELLTKPLNTSTLQLDQDMDELERDIPEDWWHIKPRKGWRAGNHRVFIQFMHYHIRVFIHLPFMLKSATEKRFHHHRVSALQASRKMLDTYKVLRSEVFVRGNSCSKAVGGFQKRQLQDANISLARFSGFHGRNVAGTQSTRILYIRNERELG